MTPSTSLAPHRFVGTWHLDPSLSDYEFGQPPKQGTLTFHYDGQHLRYTMEWTTADDKDMTLTLEVVPDGQDHPYHDNPAFADATRYTMIDEFTLDSEAKKQGVVVAYARRTLSPGGRSMAITQSGRTPEGATFDNRSVYRRA